MKEILILGTGCAKCNKLYDTAKKAVESLGVEHNLKKITDIQEIMKYGIAMTPALIIDGEVKAVGKVPSVDEIKNMLK
ncbi:MAG: thioredoxin family protein [candidate division Zixibacteria bacterium HGW-Zixibacteria-1]|nr:MAG: thioredoxin family protein [candidate division Zixibacteria bacterium HGW-Zixibacteria-1]